MLSLLGYVNTPASYNCSFIEKHILMLYDFRPVETLERQCSRSSYLLVSTKSLS